MCSGNAKQTFLNFYFYKELGWSGAGKLKISWELPNHFHFQSTFKIFREQEPTWGWPKLLATYKK